MKSNTHIFLLSIVAALITLIFERAIGIEWDFHPDSVTYATTSHEISKNILNEGIGSAINNSYYFICSILEQSITAIIAMNMIFFALTNLVILRLHVKFTGDINLAKYSLLLLLLLNPYRMHLATTMLKDTLIIFFAVSSLMGIRYFIFFCPSDAFFKGCRYLLLWNFIAETRLCIRCSMCSMYFLHTK